MSTVVIDLPLGPASNNLFANVRRGRVKTSTYRQWIKDAGWALKIQRVRPVAGRVDILVEIGTKGRGDADGRLKAPIDLLVEHQIIPDDSKAHVRSASARWTDGVEGCRLTITPAVDAEAA